MRALLDEREAPAAVLGGAAAVAWVTGGVVNRIERGHPSSPLWIVVTPGSVVALTTNVEWPRLAAEADLAALGATLVEVEWYGEGGLGAAAADVVGAPLAACVCDAPAGPGVDGGDDDLTALRLRLTPAERRRLEALGRDAAVALETALAAWQPGERDLDVEARAVELLERADALAVCLIVGADERVERFRHPLATGAAAERLVMAVVVAERNGIHAAATRFVSAARLPPRVRDARRAALSVEAATLAACRPGAAYGDVLIALERAYADAGHADAWREHYQGGPIGYRQREFEIVPTQTDSRWFATRLETGHALAWNPSVAGGGKSEDTYLLDEDGLRRLTDSGVWPLEQDGRPAVLDIATGEAA